MTRYHVLLPCPNPKLPAARAVKKGVDPGGKKRMNRRRGKVEEPEQIVLLGEIEIRKDGICCQKRQPNPLRTPARNRHALSL